jgi:hypothetical protein
VIKFFQEALMAITGLEKVHPFLLAEPIP